MRIRSRERYLSEEVDRWLRMISAAHNKIFTPDEIADHILREVLIKKCPVLADFQKTVDRLALEAHDDIRKTLPLIIVAGEQPRLGI